MFLHFSGGLVMSFCDWLIVADAVVGSVLAAGYVWLGSVAWADLQRKPAVRRHPGHYGTQSAAGGDS